MLATSQWHRIAAIITSIQGPHWGPFNLTAGNNEPLVTLYGPAMEAEITYSAEEDFWNLNYSDLTTDREFNLLRCLAPSTLAEEIRKLIKTSLPDDNPTTATGVLRKALADNHLLGLGHMRCHGDDADAVWRIGDERLRITRLGTSGYWRVTQETITAEETTYRKGEWHLGTSEEAASIVTTCIQLMHQHFLEDEGVTADMGWAAHLIQAMAPDAAQSVSFDNGIRRAHLSKTHGDSWMLLLFETGSTTKTRSFHGTVPYPLTSEAAGWLRNTPRPSEKEVEA